jgi:phosphoribosylformylglycinamidine cyclo-ligase
VAFVDYLAIDEPSETFSAQIGEGLKRGAEEADIALVGGETAVMPEVVRGLDLAGTCAGLAPKDALFEGRAEAGDAIVGFRSSGIHSNGLTLAREAVTRRHEYTDAYPLADERDDEPTYDSVGSALLEPTRIYTHLLEPMRRHGVHAAAHVTGGGWTNLTRMGGYRYVVDDPFDAHSVFAFVQEEGNVSTEEMHRTFNMGTGFVCTLPPTAAESLAEETDGRVVGRVEEASDDASVEVRGLTL